MCRSKAGKFFNKKQSILNRRVKNIDRIHNREGEHIEQAGRPICLKAVFGSTDVKCTFLLIRWNRRTVTTGYSKSHEKTKSNKSPASDDIPAELLVWKNKIN